MPHRHEPQRSRQSKGDARRFLQLAPDVSEQEADILIDLVRRHGVTWEVWPERQVFSGEVRQIGFEIDLVARHDQPRHAPHPGCAECQIAYAALRRIAWAVTPRGERDSRYDVVRYDGGMEYPHANAEGLMRLVLKILHGSGHDLPLDPCQVECLKEIETKLEVLGAVRGRRNLGG